MAKFTNKSSVLTSTPFHVPSILNVACTKESISVAVSTNSLTDSSLRGTSSDIDFCTDSNALTSWGNKVSFQCFFSYTSHNICTSLREKKRLVSFLALMTTVGCTECTRQRNQCFVFILFRVPFVFHIQSGIRRQPALTFHQHIYAARVKGEYVECHKLCRTQMVAE